MGQFNKKDFEGNGAMRLVVEGHLCVEIVTSLSLYKVIIFY